MSRKVSIKILDRETTKSVSNGLNNEQERVLSLIETRLSAVVGNKHSVRGQVATNGEEVEHQNSAGYFVAFFHLIYCLLIKI